MTFIYENTLPTDKDHVRFLIGDTDSANQLLQDEEIAAAIADETATGEALKYYAAARCLSVLLTQWASKGQGLIEEKVDDLQVKRGVAQSGAQALQARIGELRQRGSFLLRPTPRLFKAV